MHRILQVQASNIFLHGLIHWKTAIILWHSERIQHRSATTEYVTGKHVCEPPALLNVKTGHDLVCISVFSILLVFSRL